VAEEVIEPVVEEVVEPVVAEVVKAPVKEARKAPEAAKVTKTEKEVVHGSALSRKDAVADE
jgi:hypothetical protein